MATTSKWILEEKKSQSKILSVCSLVAKIKVTTRIISPLDWLSDANEKFLKRSYSDTPRSRRLGTNSKSNVLFYLTGHGGENFLKFQDDEEISAKELSDAFEQMKQKERFNELLFIIGNNSVLRSF